MIKIITILICLIVFWLFYSLQIRPSIIRSECNKQAEKQAAYAAKKRNIPDGWFLTHDYESYYKRCLREKGIEK